MSRSTISARRLLTALLGAGLLASTPAVAAVQPQSAQPTQGAQPTGEPQPRGIALFPRPGTPGRSASGSHFELGAVAAGASVRGTVLARNIGDTTESGDLYPADATPARGGGFGFTTRDERPVDLGSWITLDRTRISLRPQEETTFGFTLVVPPGATAGEHVGGIVLEPVAPTSGGSVAITTRVALGVYLTVTGGDATAPRPGLTITRLAAPLRDGQACPTVAYTNSGTTVLDPTVEIVVDPAIGREPRRYAAGKSGGVAPGASVEVDLPCVREVPIGRSRLTVNLDYPGGREGRAVDVNRWPFTVVAAGSLLLLILLALLWLLLAAKRRNDDHEETRHGRSLWRRSRATGVTD